MGNEWENLRESSAGDDRIKAQQDWAKRREEHFASPNPGMYDSIVRKLGNFTSNMGLEKQERRDMDWKNHETDMQGGFVLDSPIDAKRFNVYENIMRAKSAGLPVSPQDSRDWQVIKSGSVPE